MPRISNPVANANNPLLNDHFTITASFLPDRELMRTAKSCRAALALVTTNNNEWRARAQRQGITLGRNLSPFQQYIAPRGLAHRVMAAYARGRERAGEMMTNVLNRPFFQAIERDDPEGGTEHFSPTVVALNRITIGSIIGASCYVQRATSALSVTLGGGAVALFLTGSGLFYLTRNTGVVEEITGQLSGLKIKVSSTAHRLLNSACCNRFGL